MKWIPFSSKPLSLPAVATDLHSQTQAFRIQTAGHGCAWNPTLARSFSQTWFQETWAFYLPFACISSYIQTTYTDSTQIANLLYLTSLWIKGSKLVHTMYCKELQIICDFYIGYSWKRIVIMDMKLRVKKWTVEGCIFFRTCAEVSLYVLGSRVCIIRFNTRLNFSQIYSYSPYTICDYVTLLS